MTIEINTFSTLDSQIGNFANCLEVAQLFANDLLRADTILSGEQKHRLLRMCIEKMKDDCETALERCNNLKVHVETKGVTS